MSSTASSRSRPYSADRAAPARPTRAPLPASRPAGEATWSHVNAGRAAERRPDPGGHAERRGRLGGVDPEPAPDALDARQAHLQAEADALRRRWRLDEVLARTGPRHYRGGYV